MGILAILEWSGVLPLDRPWLGHQLKDCLYFSISLFFIS
jgi:hypothetical protein